MLSGCEFRHCHSIVNFPKSLWQISSKRHLKKQSCHGLRWRDFSWINDCLIDRKQRLGLGLGLRLAFVMKGSC